MTKSDYLRAAYECQNGRMPCWKIANNDCETCPIRTKCSDVYTDAEADWGWNPYVPSSLLEAIAQVLAEKGGCR